MIAAGIAVAFWLFLAALTEIVFRPVWDPLIVDVPLIVLAWAVTRPHRPRWGAVLFGAALLVIARVELGGSTYVVAVTTVAIGLLLVASTRRLFDRRPVTMRAAVAALAAIVADHAGRQIGGFPTLAVADLAFLCAIAGGMSVAMFVLLDDIKPRVFRDPRRGL